MEEKAIVDRELQYIADDLLTYSLDLLNQGTDEDNGGKIHIATCCECSLPQFMKIMLNRSLKP